MPPVGYWICKLHIWHLYMIYSLTDLWFFLSAFALLDIIKGFKLRFKNQEYSIIDLHPFTGAVYVFV